jgi:GNAT superfamily N-acetyltransferase
VDNLRFETLPQAEIDLVRPLWEKLNEIHAGRSAHFAAEYRAMTFEKRKKMLLAGGRTAWLVEIARDTATGEIAAYCLSSINRDREGEIDSLYVEPAYRRFRVADALMRRALDWLNGQGALSKKIVVAAGNEEVLPFYEFYDFYPRQVVLLERKSEK